MLYTTLGLLATSRVHLLERRRRIVTQELAGLIEKNFKLDLKGKRNKTSLTRGKHGAAH